MAIIKNRFYFGPSGEVALLPSFPRDVGITPTPNLFGAVTRSLTGVPTLVSYGAKRTWQLKWNEMTEATARPLAILESAFRQRTARAYYLLDTRNTNYLSPDASACGAEDPMASVFSWSAGFTSRTKTGVFHADLAGGLVDGYAVHAAAAIGTSMQTNKQQAVLAGSSYLFSGYFAGSGSIQLTLFFYDNTGTFISAVISGTTTVLSGTTTGTVAQFAFAAASVPSGAATFNVGYKTTTLNATVNFNGWMVQMDETVRPAAGWYPGRGGAVVLVDSFEITYPRFKTQQIAARLQEV